MKQIRFGEGIRGRFEVHLHRHAALAGKLRGYLCQGDMAANDLRMSRLIGVVGDRAVGNIPEYQGCIILRRKIYS